MKYKYDYLNPTEDTNPLTKDLPSFRGQDQMCIYTFHYKYKTTDNFTGTNPYGIEASVDKDGNVCEILDRVTILQDGFVVSGHGTAANFITDNIKIGSVIKLCDNFIEVINDENKIKAASISKQYNKLITNFKNAKENRYIFDIVKVENLIKEIEIEKNKVDCDYQRLSNMFFEAFNLMTESKMISARSVWARPQSKTLEELVSRLDHLANMNINGIYLESFYNGSVLYDSKITDKSEDVVGGYYGIYKDDYLLALITEAHKRDIEVHAWVENFFVGESVRHWKKWYKDSWHMVNYDNTFVQGEGDGNAELVENGFIFLDPANPECLEYILSIYKEMFDRYDFDGINIDYVRYPHGNLRLETSNGYSEYAIKEFLELNNLNGDIRELVKDKEIYQKWTDYRVGKINNLVCEIKKVIDTYDKKIQISTAVVDDVVYAKNNKMQDWISWVDNKEIDIIFPMAYYIGSSEVAKSTKCLVDIAKLNAYSYTGIMPVQEGTNEYTIIDQISKVYDNNAQGYNIFQINDILNSKYAEKVISMGVNRFKAVLPHGSINKIIETLIIELELKNNLYNLKLESLILELNENILSDVRTQIRILNKNLELVTDLSIKKDLEYVIKLLMIHINKKEG